MVKSHGIVLAFAASTLIGVGAPAAQVSPGKAGPDCAAVFQTNQPKIEQLADYKTAEDLAKYKTAEDLALRGSPEEKARHKAAEDLARRKATTDIQAIFVRAGCAAPTVNLPSTQRRASIASLKIKCRFKALPPSLICTF